jgi:glycosyltransferase involved in cell wall biosynthesis
MRKRTRERLIRIGLDLTALLPDATGVDHYLIRLVTHLGRVDHDREYVLFVNYEDRHRLAGRLPRNFRTIPASLRPRPARLAFQQIGLPLAARGLGIDVIHSPSFLMPLYRGIQRHVLTVYDLSFFTHPIVHIPLRRSGVYRRAVVHSIRRADVVTVPSRFTRQQILDLVPGVSAERIRVIAPGVDEQFRPRPADEVREAAARLGLPPAYLLFVGTIEPRKNLARLLESYARLIATRDVAEHLVLAGRLGWGYGDLLTRIAAPPLRGRVHFLGYARQENLPWIYAGARLFVYPSLEEGFGFPPLEAMACGVPTISSSSSSLVENLHGAAELVDPHDSAALTGAMDRLLRDEGRRAELAACGPARAAEFRWDETARQTLACYREVAG